MKQKKNIKHNAKNANYKRCGPKETRMHDNKVEAGLFDSEESDISDNSEEKKKRGNTMKG